MVLYLTRIAAAKDTLRATALTFFAASYLASLILQAAVVGIASGVWVTAALLLPLARGDASGQTASGAGYGEAAT